MAKKKIRIFSSGNWKDTYDAMERWKKTPGYQIWRKRQYAQQNAECYYCSVDLRTVRTNVEHLIPKSMGGTNHPKNLVLACSACNKAKGSTLLTDQKLDYLAKRHKNKQIAYRAEIAYQEELGLWLRSWV